MAFPSPLPGARVLADDQLQRFVFAVASAVWSVGDADATVRTLKETFRQYQLEQQYRRTSRDAAHGPALASSGPGHGEVHYGGDRAGRGVVNGANQQGLQAAFYEQRLGHKSKSGVVLDLYTSTDKRKDRLQYLDIASTLNSDVSWRCDPQSGVTWLSNRCGRLRDSVCMHVCLGVSCPSSLDVSLCGCVVVRVCVTEMCGSAGVCCRSGVPGCRPQDAEGPLPAHRAAVQGHLHQVPQPHRAPAHAQHVVGVHRGRRSPEGLPAARDWKVRTRSATSPRTHCRTQQQRRAFVLIKLSLQTKAAPS